MSTPPPGAPPPPPGHTLGYYHAPEFSRPSKSRARTVPIIVSGLIGLGIGVAGTLGAVVLTTGFGKDDENVAGPNETTPTASQPATTPDRDDIQSTPSPEESSYEPTVDDFDVETSIKEQRCFGSAGCNVTLRTEPVYIGTQTPTGTWEVTYEISGTDDGPVIRTFEVIDDQVSFQDEARLSTPDQDTELQIEITEVREGFSEQ